MVRGESLAYQYNPYIWPLIASSGTSMSLGVYALIRRRGTRGAGSFIVSMLIVSLWSAGNALEMSSIDINTKLFWANMQYIAYCYSPVALLVLCMQFTGYDRWMGGKKTLALLVIPTVILMLVWTDSFHGLIRYDIHMDYSGTFPVIVKKYGPGFFVHALYSHAINILAWLMVARTSISRKALYRKQAAALHLGMSLIIIPNIMYITGLGPVGRFDITPAFFGPAGLIIAWGIFRFGMLDVIPVARATVIETMDAGVMVLDERNRVLDTNPAFEKTIGLNASAVLGRPVEQVCGKIPEIIHACADKSISHSEFTVGVEEVPRTFEMLLSPLNDNSGALIGRLIVIHDITERKKSLQEYMYQQRLLAAKEERESLAKDIHDNLGQVLGFIAFQAQGIRQELINSGVQIVSHRLDKLAKAAQGAHDELREFIQNARGSVLRDIDLAAEISKYINDFREQSGIKVQLSIPKEFPGESLIPDIRSNALNIVREALNNIRKHAQAENVKVTVFVEQGLLGIEIEDDGTGFDAGRLNGSKNTGFGLGIMRERAREMDARIEIELNPGKGSRVSLHVPITEERKGSCK